MVDCRIRQVVVLYSNDCMGICLGRLSTGLLRRVVFGTSLTVFYKYREKICLKRPSDDNTQIEWQTLKPVFYMKFSEFC